MNSKNNIRELKTNLIKELEEQKEQILDNEELIYEYAKAFVPVWDSELLEACISDHDLGRIEDVDDKEQFEGIESAYDIIRRNTESCLVNEALKWLENLKDKKNVNK